MIGYYQRAGDGGTRWISGAPPGQEFYQTASGSIGFRADRATRNARRRARYAARKATELATKVPCLNGYGKPQDALRVRRHLQEAIASVRNTPENWPDGGDSATQSAERNTR